MCKGIDFLKNRYVNLLLIREPGGYNSQFKEEVKEAQIYME